MNISSNKITRWCLQEEILKTVPKPPKPSPAASEFLFEVDPVPAAEILTSYGGAPLLIRTLRSLGVPQSVAQHIHIKQRQRGYDEASFVESLRVAEWSGRRLSG